MNNNYYNKLLVCSAVFNSNNPQYMCIYVLTKRYGNQFFHNFFSLLLISSVLCVYNIIIFKGKFTMRYIKIFNTANMCIFECVLPVRCIHGFLNFLIILFLLSVSVRQIIVII